MADAGPTMGLNESETVEDEASAEAAFWANEDKEKKGHRAVAVDTVGKARLKGAVAAKAAGQPRGRLRPLVEAACTYDSVQGLGAEIKSKIPHSKSRCVHATR